MKNENEEILKPWVEKYRPTKLENVLLDEDNKKIITNIKNKNYLPNLLLFGPPGTGKTTTILNLLNDLNIQKNNIIHLNASDERGIDIIRNQIYNFIHFKQIYESEIKIVVLDEVDYMTKTAQLLLKQIVKKYKNVRFCLICNYISKIIKPLQNIFLKLYFYNNKKQEILQLLKHIIKEEKINLSEYSLNLLINNYNTDIRSMINHLQMMQNINNYEINIITDDIMNDINKIIKNINNDDLNIKKISKIENKLNNFFFNNKLDFNKFYIKFINQYIYKNLPNDIITNIKILYMDELNNIQDKIKFFLYQIIIPINSIY